jgi:hypothetical protein
MANPFSPNYQTPAKTSGYFKMSDGSNLIRILSAKEDVITYFVEFIDGSEGKKEKITYPDRGDGSFPETLGEKPTKLIWAVIIYNHDLKKVQVAEFSQKTIQSYLYTIASGKIKNDWRQFDIQITKTGQNMDTEYTLMTGDTQPLSSEDQAICKAEYSKINLEKMLTAEDPFSESK